MHKLVHVAGISQRIEKKSRASAREITEGQKKTESRTTAPLAGKGNSPVVLCLEKIEFLFDSIAGLGYCEFELLPGLRWTLKHKQSAIIKQRPKLKINTAALVRAYTATHPHTYFTHVVHATTGNFASGAICYIPVYSCIRVHIEREKLAARACRKFR